MTSRSPQRARSKNAGSVVTHWFVLLLILLFAGLSIALISLGAQAYQVIDRHSNANMQRRTAVGYVMNRVRTLDGIADIRVEEFLLNGKKVQALVLGEWFDGDAYETRIYCADGMLREQFVGAEASLEYPEDGEEICELDRFLIIMEGNLLRFEFTHADGTVDVVHTALRAESGVE